MVLRFFNPLTDVILPTGVMASIGVVPASNVIPAKAGIHDRLQLGQLCCLLGCTAKVVRTIIIRLVETCRRSRPSPG